MVCVVGGGGGGGDMSAYVKSKCRLRQLLVAVSLCSGLVTYCGVCCGGEYVYLCEV